MQIVCNYVTKYIIHCKNRICLGSDLCYIKCTTCTSKRSQTSVYTKCNVSRQIQAALSIYGTEQNLALGVCWTNLRPKHHQKTKADVPESQWNHKKMSNCNTIFGWQGIATHSIDIATIHLPLVFPDNQWKCPWDVNIICLWIFWRICIYARLKQEQKRWTTILMISE